MTENDKIDLLELEIQRDNLLLACKMVIKWEADKPLSYVAFEQIRKYIKSVIEECEHPL
jgi:hypothetical protein